MKYNSVNRKSTYRFTIHDLRFTPFDTLKKGVGGICSLLLTLCFLLCELSFAADTLQPRLVFSDANISFTFPNRWTLQANFPYGPLFTKTLQDGSQAYISCAISELLEQNRISADISHEVLKQLARRELQSREKGYRSISEKDRRIAGQSAFEITWESIVSSRTVQHQTFYFYAQNRIYALSLEAPPRPFRFALPDFQHWLMSLRVLSRKDSGALADPARGGLWIHQTGGVKILVPTDWLIAVSDDRTLGVTLARGDQHVDLTATVDVSSNTVGEFSQKDKREAFKAIHKEGFRILSETDEPFHGLPARVITYEGTTGARVLKGTDIWVLSPKGRWLFNLEGDVSLYNSLSESIQELLNHIEFI